MKAGQRGSVGIILDNIEATQCYLFFLSFCFCIFPDIFPLYLLPPLKMLFDPPKLEPLNLFLIIPPSIYVTLYSSLLYFSPFVSTYICKSLLFSLHSSLHMHIIQFIIRVSSYNISTFTNVFLFSLNYIIAFKIIYYYISNSS